MITQLRKLALKFFKFIKIFSRIFPHILQARCDKALLPIEGNDRAYKSLQIVFQTKINIAKASN